MSRFIALALTFMSNAAVVAEFEVGEHVAAIRGTEIVRGNKEVARIKLGDMLQVVRIKKDRVYVDHASKGWVRAADLRSLDDAEKHFVDQLNKDPQPQVWQALSDVREKQFDVMLENLTLDFSNSLGVGERTALVDVVVAGAYLHVRQARELLNEKKYDEAQREVDRALAANPKMHRAVYVRGKIFEAQGNSEKAVAAYTEYIRREPKSDDGYHARAWVLATSADAKIRSGEKAVNDARTAGRLFEWRDSRLLDTLAAALAEAGKFKEAVAWQELAVRIAAVELKDDYKARLKLYREGKPYRRGRAQ